MIELQPRELVSVWHLSLANPDFIIVGEMHGSQQNAPLIQQLATALLAHVQQLTIAFEWILDDAELNVLRDYVHGGATPEHLPEFFFDSDGRVTYDHIDLLRWIRTYNAEHKGGIDIFAFDETSGYENVEQTLADALLFQKAQQPDSLLLVETGSMHARKAPYLLDAEEHVPMAAILKETYVVSSVFLKYTTGNVLVEGVPRAVTQASAQQESPEPYFDAVVNIPESQAAPEITDLTKALERFKIKEGTNQTRG